MPNLLPPINRESDEFRIALGKAVRAQREAKGLTQGDLVERIPSSMKVDTVRRLENGYVKARPTTLAKIATALDTNAELLLRLANSQLLRRNDEERIYSSDGIERETRPVKGPNFDVLSELAKETDSFIYQRNNEIILQSINGLYESSGLIPEIDTTRIREAAMQFIVSQEIRDFHHALEQEVKRILCVDTSVISSNNLWMPDAAYKELDDHTGGILKRGIEIERVFVLDIPEEGSFGNVDTMSLYHTVNNQVNQGIKVYLVDFKSLPRNFGVLNVSHDILNFHAIDGEVADVMDLNSLLSHRFVAKTASGRMVISLFVELFELLKARAVERNNALIWQTEFQPNDLQDFVDWIRR